jgi:hypothetical protein
MNIFGKTVIRLFLTAGMLASCNSFQSTPTISDAEIMETAISTVSTTLAGTQRAIATNTPIPLPTISFLEIPGAASAQPATSTPLVFTDPSIPLSERIVYYYLVHQSENPIPKGAVRAAHLLAPTYADETYTSDTAADLRTALDIVLHDERNDSVGAWLEAEIVDVTFRLGHAKVLLQGEYPSTHPSAAPANPRMLILLTVFANPSVQSAVVSLNEDTIANLGVTDSSQAKPANYVFTRAEIETYMIEQSYVTPSPIPPTRTPGPTSTPFVSIDPSLPLPELSPDAIDLQWITAYGLPGDQIVTKIHPTRDGGFILLGNVVLLKLRADGLILWQKFVGQVTALDVLETSSGDFILAGDLHWIKLDSQGNLVWQYRFERPSYHTGPILRLVEERNGNILVEALGSHTVFSADGELQSITEYAMNWDSQTYAGKVRDRSGETLWAGGGESMSHQFWVGKADLNNGWLKVFSFDPAPHNAHQIAGVLFIQTISDGGALAGVSVYAGEGAFDLIISRFSRDGSVRWQKTYPGAASDFHAFETQSGDFIVAGTLGYYVNAGREDVWILRLDREGNLRWMKLYSTAGSNPDGRDAVAVIQELPNGDLIFAGHTNGIGTGNQDMWILKTNAQGEIPNCGLALDTPEWLERTGGVSPKVETIALEGVSLIEREVSPLLEDDQSLDATTARAYPLCLPSR